MILQSFMKIASAVLEILADKVGMTHTGTKSNHFTTVAYTAKGQGLKTTESTVSQKIPFATTDAFIAFTSIWLLGVSLLDLHVYPN